MNRSSGESRRITLCNQVGEEFTLSGHRAFVILPPVCKDITAQPWIWYAPTLPGLPTLEEEGMIGKFLDAGIAIAGIDVGESYGSPRGRELFSALYDELNEIRGFSKKPALLARSRGGLMLYNWAVEHPDSVSCVAGIYPVCNLRSYPGLAKASVAYEMSETELAAELANHNPVDRIAPLAQAGVPIFHLHGDNDEVVPLEENSALLAENYRKHGGDMELIVVKRQGHNRDPHWFQSTALMNFVIKYA
jgi:hypothetical protein